MLFNSSSDWMGEVCHHVCFQWLSPSRLDISLSLPPSPTLSQAGWHLDSSEGRGKRGSKRKILPEKGQKVFSLLSKGVTRSMPAEIKMVEAALSSIWGWWGFYIGKAKGFWYVGKKHWNGLCRLFPLSFNKLRKRQETWGYIQFAINFFSHFLDWFHRHITIDKTADMSPYLCQLTSQTPN